MTSLLHDLRSALRSLRRAPRFTAAVVITLALGLGANTAIFSVVNHLLLHPLPYPDSDRLVYLSLGGQSAQFHLGPMAFIASAWKEQARTLDGMEAFATRDLLATGGQGAQLMHGMTITPGLPRFLGVRPVLGRAFVSDDARPGAPPVALISAAMWHRDYGGASNIIGRSITLDGTPRTVIGVMPPGWDVIADASDPADVWLPLSLHAPADSITGPGFTSVDVVARLRPGVPRAQLQRELDTLTARARAAEPHVIYGLDFTTRITPPSQEFVEAGTHDALLVLLAAVGVVLLVACANVANLLLARGTARRRELALRAALGASRWRLVRQLLAESILLALAAGVVGIGIGWWTLDLLVRLRPENLSALRGVGLDPLVLEFTFALALITGVLFGLVPAFQVTSSRLGHVLRSGGSGVVRGGGSRFRGVLVAGEMALSVVLLVSAGLLVRSVVYLQHVDTGFNAHNLFAVHLSLPRSRYQTSSSRELFARQMLDGIHGTPGVAAATQAYAAPPNFSATSGIQIQGRTLSAADQHGFFVFNSVQSDYFRTLGIPVLHGHTFTAAEMRSGNPVIINEALARHCWPGESAIGHQLRSNPGGPWATVVGVAADAASGGLTRDLHAPELYWPYRAATAPFTLGMPPGLVFIVRSTSDPAQVIAAIRQLTRSLDPDVAIPRVDLTTTQLARSMAGPRFNMALLTAFAVLALALAAIGLAAVIGYAVTERTHEIGIRMALGAREGNVLRLVVMQGM
ncbi:MAG TPA: ABC transporter permease, partial [Gemmatimonadaceae bacterium]|nr:ABC transporter permease [Gemmatimonadaceae bacterium]